MVTLSIASSNTSMDNPTTEVIQSDVVARRPLYPDNSWFGVNCKLYLLLVYLFLICGLCLFGLVGNGLSLAVLWQDRKTSPTAFLLMCLAAADDFVLLSWTALFGPFALRIITEQVYYKAMYFLKVFEPICTIAHSLTTWFTIAVTWHRFIAVCKPHHKAIYASFKVAYTQALTIVLMSILIDIPRFFEYTVQTDEHGLPKVYGTALYHNNLYQKLFKITFYYVVIYIIPLSSLIYMTYRLIRELRRAKKRQQKMMTSGQMAKEDLTWSLITVVIVFIICQLFNPIRRIVANSISSANTTHMICSSLFYNMALWAIVITNLNSSCNFVIYTLVGKRFRQRLFQMLGIKQKRVTPAQGAGDNKSNMAGTCNQIGGQSVNTHTANTASTHLTASNV